MTPTAEQIKKAEEIWLYRVRPISNPDEITRRLAQALCEAVQEQIEKDAKIAEECAWILPLYKDQKVNEASDDCAVMVCEQISEAIRKQEISK